MPKTTCPSCGQRSGRRFCPALGKQMCAPCCGTKRVVEIQCPSDCSYLKSAELHPPAVVQRQQERDLRFLWPILQGLSDPQHELLLMVQAFLRDGQPGRNPRTDDEVVQAAAALAETYETANRGIIYEHQARSLSAQELVADLRTLLLAREKEGGRVRGGDVAVVMRRVEAAAKGARQTLAPTDPVGPGGPLENAETVYLDLLRRLLKPRDAGAEKEPPAPGTSGLIVPG
jgi:hypothetical protein